MGSTQLDPVLAALHQYVQDQYTQITHEATMHRLLFGCHIGVGVTDTGPYWTCLSPACPAGPVVRA